MTLEPKKTPLLFVEFAIYQEPGKGHCIVTAVKSTRGRSNAVPNMKFKINLEEIRNEYTKRFHKIQGQIPKY